MPLAIILAAIVLIAAGIRGSYKDLAQLLVGDFTGDGNFLNWVAAIGLVGALGYVPALQKFSRMFLGLIIVTMFIKSGSGVFDQLVSAIQGSSADTSHPNPGAASTNGSTITDGVLGGLGLPSLKAITGGFTPTTPAPATTPGGTPNPAAAASGNLATSIVPDNGMLMGP